MVSERDGRVWMISAGGIEHAEPFLDRAPDAFAPGRTDPAEDIGSLRSRSPSRLAGKILCIAVAKKLVIPGH